MMTDEASWPRETNLIDQELAEREAELAIINSVQQALASRLDVQAIYTLVGDKIRDIFDSQVVMISTYDPDTQTIEHVYAIERGEHIYAPGRYPIRGFRTQIVETRQPVLVNTNVAELAASLGQHTIPGTITPKSWLGVPMMVGEQVTGILSLQHIDRENAFDESDVRLLQTLAASMSVALENARLFDEAQRLLDETKQRAYELQIINRLQEGLAKKLDRAAIYEMVGEKLNTYFQPADLSIVVYDPETDLLSTPFQVENGERQVALPYSLSGKGFIVALIKDPRELLINEHMEEAVLKYQNVYSSGRALPKSALYIPIIIGDQVHGAIVLKDMEHERAFNETDIRLLKTVSNAMSIALENTRLWEQEHLYRKALEREFEIGREIQSSFLPLTLPQPHGWEIEAALKSAREVSGDFYDAFELIDEKIGIVIADVCDKGLGAALFMTLFRSLIRAVSNIDFFTSAEYTGTITPSRRIKNAVSLTNKYIAEIHGHTSMFCTIFFGILDTHSGKLSYVNGGHLPPMVIDCSGIKETLRVTGPAVGLDLESNYTIGEITLDPGDILFAYTDGLPDMINSKEEYFTNEMIIPLFAEDQPLSTLLDRIKVQIEQFSVGSTQMDDITMLVVRRNINQFTDTPPD
jgi:serine phosphatase RsbU (regulator of sigma subunit)